MTKSRAWRWPLVAAMLFLWPTFSNAAWGATMAEANRLP